MHKIAVAVALLTRAGHAQPSQKSIKQFHSHRSAESWALEMLRCNECSRSSDDVVVQTDQTSRRDRVEGVARQLHALAGILLLLEPATAFGTAHFVGRGRAGSRNVALGSPEFIGHHRSFVNMREKMLEITDETTDETHVNMREALDVTDEEESASENYHGLTPEKHRKLQENARAIIEKFKADRAAALNTSGKLKNGAEPVSLTAEEPQTSADGAPKPDGTVDDEPERKYTSPILIRWEKKRKEMEAQARERAKAVEKQVAETRTNNETGTVNGQNVTKPYDKFQISDEAKKRIAEIMEKHWHKPKAEREQRQEEERRRAAELSNENAETSSELTDMADEELKQQRIALSLKALREAREKVKRRKELAQAVPPAAPRDKDLQKHQLAAKAEREQNAEARSKELIPTASLLASLPPKQPSVGCMRRPKVNKVRSEAFDALFGEQDADAMRIRMKGAETERLQLDKLITFVDGLNLTDSKTPITKLVSARPKILRMRVSKQDMQVHSPVPAIDAVGQLQSKLESSWSFLNDASSITKDTKKQKKGKLSAAQAKLLKKMLKSANVDPNSPKAQTVSFMVEEVEAGRMDAKQLAAFTSLLS